MERRKFLQVAWLGISLPAMAGVLPPPHINTNNKSNRNMRIKTFDVPHKGIRNGLSQLSLLAGKTDYSNEAQVARLHELGREVFLILSTHARDENDVSLKHLEEKMKGASHHDMEEHIRLHVAQSRLEKILDEFYADARAGRKIESGSTFYTLLADFHADYLQHMSEEERDTQQLLWDNFSDEELAEHRVEIMKNLAPDTLLTWFKYVAPAQSHEERVGLFRGFKANAPVPFFERAKRVLEETLPKEEYDLLMDALR